MKLHDPDTEKDLIRIAREVAGVRGFESPGFSFLKDIFQRSLAFLITFWIAAIVLGPAFDEKTPTVVNHAVCVFLLMFLIRLGLGQIAMAFTVSGFFGTLANLPVTGSKALTHLRGVILRRFWLPALLGSFAIAIYLHLPVDPAKFTHVLSTWALFTSMIWATLGISQVFWVHRLRLVKIWQWIACCLIAYLIAMHFFGGRFLMPSESLATMENLLGRILWVFPPAWVLPGKLEHGGIIPASLWIVWGMWSWLRWPATAFPGYDRPQDFLGAFGDIGQAQEETAASEAPPTAGDGIIPLDPPPRPPSGGWVEKIITASIPAADHAAAGALMPVVNYTRKVNFIMLFAALWLLALGFGKNHFITDPHGELVLLVSWAVPAIVFVLGLLPIANPLKDAILPCAVGNTPVPLFTTLPVSFRCLFRLTSRITMVRSLIAVAIATPFFWALAMIHQLPHVATYMLALIPAIGAAWILSAPAVLTNRVDPHLRRRKGIFPLILATSLAQVPIGFLWIISSIAGIGLAVFWAAGGNDGQHAVFLLPAALACLAFGGAMSRLLFEILHFSIRQRRYDWKSKIR